MEEKDLMETVVSEESEEEKEESQKHRYIKIGGSKRKKKEAGEEGNDEAEAPKEEEVEPEEAPVEEPKEEEQPKEEEPVVSESDLDNLFGDGEKKEEPIEEPKEEVEEEASEPVEEVKEEPQAEEEAPVEEPVQEEEPVIEEPKKVYPERYDDIYPRPEPRLPKPEGPNMLFYAERKNTIPATGQVLYTGDDGLPYVDNNVILAADGVGGTSCIRHTKFNRGLFEEDLVFEAIFGDMYGRKEDNPILNDYVIDSFAVVMSMRNLYDGGPVNIGKFRKSGHFGSRIASAAMLHQLLNEETQNTIFELFDNVKNARLTNDVEAEQNCIKEVAEPITETFRREFIKAGEKAGLEYESRNAGLDLLGTTLCATIVRENEEDVDAFYLMAGDSLPYLLDKDGLAEVMHAHEGADGGMTNRVRANDDQIIEAFKNVKTINKFYLEPKVINVKKPCILFNASDGVFDCFVHPMNLEKMILDDIIAANSYDELAKIMHDFFEAYCSIDDSSTLAAKFFGFNNYEEVKAFAQARLDAIQREYLNEETGGLPTLFEHNYAIELNNLQSKERDNLNKVFFAINGNPQVDAFYKQRLADKERDLAHLHERLEKTETHLEYFKQELQYHAENVKLDEKFAKYEDDIRGALGREIKLFEDVVNYIRNKIVEKEGLVLYKSFRDEWLARGVRAVETLIAGEVYTKEQMAELLNRYDVKLDDKTDPETENLMRLAERQRQLFDKYNQGYNRIAD